MSKKPIDEVHLNRKYRGKIEPFYIIKPENENRYYVETHGVKLWADRIEINNAYNGILGFWNGDAIYLYSDQKMIAEIDISTEYNGTNLTDFGKDDLTDQEIESLKAIGVQINENYKRPEH